MKIQYKIKAVKKIYSLPKILNKQLILIWMEKFKIAICKILLAK